MGWCNVGWCNGPLEVRTVKSTSTLRSSPVKVKQARPDMNRKGVVYELWDAVQGLPMCVHWRDRKNLGETSKQTQDSSEKESPQKRDSSSCLGKPAPGQLGSCLSQARGKRLLEEKVLEALHIHQQCQTSNPDCSLHINPSWLPLLDSSPSPCPPWVTSYPLHPTSHPSLFPFHAVIIYSLLTSSPPQFIIRCLLYITPHYAISCQLMTPTDTLTHF